MKEKKNKKIARKKRKSKKKIVFKKTCNYSIFQAINNIEIRIG